jgi:hypothetical protein
MSIYGQLTCYTCRRTLWLGSVNRSRFGPYESHIGGSDERLLNQGLWQFLGDHIDHLLDVYLTQKMEDETPGSPDISRDWDVVCQERRGSFIAHNQVDRLPHSYEALLVLLGQGGAPPGEIRAYLESRWSAEVNARRLNDEIGRGGPFDHVEVWGRDGAPLFLIGHPYQIEDEGALTLDGMRRLGMDVMINSRTWYRNELTLQVVVCHPPTVAQARGTHLTVGGVSAKC